SVPFFTPTVVKHRSRTSATARRHAVSRPSPVAGREASSPVVSDHGPPGPSRGLRFARSTVRSQRRRSSPMPTITTRDGTRIYYKDWGTGQPVVLSHGWPLSADAWDDQMMFLASRGYRCIAHDRRGHGRSDQPYGGYDYDTFAEDLATLRDAIDVKDAILVGHSMGGGEVARYIGRYGKKRVAKAVLVSAVPPLLLKTAANPNGAPMEVFDALRNGILADRSQFWKDLSV